ncbi:sugar phosphate isomerase/epimerase [Leptotrichia sp. oral taxon 218]|uniref:sugar phosphate isomerase/epimerase family protein n=1 Tax=Leptotrichia sp. oral taxon 218 TaxID=712361 RepID=UPI001B8D1F2D|nr:TIM barrel protein [Leptotrichia sp. oral taxon 218]QUB95280.1 sugar phosphate isomerase/epimerase [Leptotrichia sp. oral taxon 218]
MKLSISNIAWDTLNDEKIYSMMEKYGFKGLEIAPTKVMGENPYEKLEEAKIWKEEIKKKYNLEISSMQSIWFGKTENLFDSKKEEKVLMDYTKKAIDFANVIECKNLVFGSPKNRNINEGKSSKNEKEFFKVLGEYAYKKNTIVGMEANPTIYNTNYINDTKSALELVKKVNSKGFLLNLDLGTIISNNENLTILQNNVKYISHVHISEPWLKMIEKREIHKNLKKILLNENYKRFISIEMTKFNEIKKLKM